MTLAGAQVVERLRAAGEPTRLRMLQLLRREELSVLELARVLGQSQPRVSRHLKLLVEAGLAERFADGAWAFHRLASGEAARTFVEQVLDPVAADDRLFEADARALDAVREERRAQAADYFARNAGRWDELRGLHTDEAVVEAAVLDAAGPGPFRRLVDLGTGTGRMLQLLAPRARAAVGLDLSRSMLNIARAGVEREGLAHAELRLGDIFGTGLPGGCADLVIVHQVLHYLAEPDRALREAGRLLADDGRLLVVDFAPHGREELREAHRHRRLGFSDAELARWTREAELVVAASAALPPADDAGLTVRVWTVTHARARTRAAA